MQITFDPQDQNDRNLVEWMLEYGAKPDEAVSTPPVVDQTMTDAPQISTNPENRVPPEEDPKIGVALDKNGTPWIEEVHAGTKTQNKDGTWKKRRGIEDADLEQAEAEARAKIASTPDPVVPESDPMPEAPDTITKEVDLESVVTEDQAAAAHALPGTEPAAMPGLPGAEQAREVSLDELASIYARAVDKNVLQGDEVLELYQAHGCKEINDIASNAQARFGVAVELERRIAAAD